MVCSKFFSIKHRNIAIIRHETKPKKWKISDDVREEDLRDKCNYGEIFHVHTNRCISGCVALHIKNCSYSRFRANKRRFRTNTVR